MAKRRNFRRLAVAGMTAAVAFTGVGFGATMASADEGAAEITTANEGGVGINAGHALRSLNQRGAPTLGAGQGVAGESFGVNLENPNYSNAGLSGRLDFTFKAPRGTTFSEDTVRWGARTGGTGAWNRGTFGAGVCNVSADRTVLDCKVDNFGVPGTTGGNQYGATALWVSLKANTPLMAYGKIDDGSFTINPTSAYASRSIPLSYTTTGTEQIGAQVDSVDLGARTADISGYGVPGATMLINGADEVTAGADGTWSFTVLDLDLTTNDIMVEQYEGPGNKTGETTVTADLSLAPVSAAAAFLPDMKQSMVISGVGQPGAEVEIWQGDKMLRTVTANAISGHFSMDVAAPNAGGEQVYTVKQTLNGVTSPTEYTVNADFGRAVSIETPLEGSTTPGGTVTFQGRGVPGAEVVVREKGKTEALQTGAALVNGVWTLRVPGVAAKQATYVVTQTGPGNNVTTAEVTLNPGVSDEQLDVLAPAQGASVDAGTVTFSGTANAGATVELYSLTSGATLGTATAAANGTWSADVNRPLSAGTYTIGVRNGGLDVKRTFTAKNAVVEQLDVVTPARGAIVDPGTVTFSGTANANADIELYSITSGASLGTTKANASGAWTVAVNKQLGEGQYTIGVRNGSLQEQRTFTVQNPVVDQLDVTTPAQHGEVAPGTVTFTGTSNANANIELRSIATGGLLGSGKATAAGAWSVNVNKTLAEGTYSIKVVNGSQEVVRAFTVKRPVVADLDVLTPAQNATVAAGTVTFTGTANANAEIELRSITTGALLGSGTANAAGDWTVDVNKQLGAANYVIRVVNDNVEVDRAFQVR